MKYPNNVSAKFLSRPNRFVAEVEVSGRRELVHVKNTGRCRELLLPGVTVYLTAPESPSRKTKYDLVAVEKLREGRNPLLINMDSQAPNEAAAEWLPSSGLFSRKAVIKREVVYNASRFDFYVGDGERRCFLEVKGVTLEKDGVAAFPDAPTERGVKHLHELAGCVKAGYEAYVLFVIQMKEITLFRPNDATHPAFGEALRLASKSGVKVLAFDCTVSPGAMTMADAVKVDLS